ncbi:response regulator transcription factor [Micromonospora sp. CPCC 206061]|uniref:response regulator transcription factor n=1 Tax=Micromonospora sp. CPCC 206061 TaxID=3122410 RepID=UPI002FF3FC58
MVVDDQPNILDMLTTVLRFHGFAVSTAATAAEAVEVAAEVRPDLVVLDVRLPDGDGLDVCRQLRASGLAAGIVFLTARESSRDKIMGLTIGGDDYVTKPFSVDELVARVRAVLRRLRPVPDAATDAGPVGLLRFADIELDEDACQVRRAGTLVALSPTEFKLLRYLMHNPGRVLSRAQILDAVWNYDFDGGSNVVDTYIGYLHRKLAPLGPPVIDTARGFGYVLRAGA